MSQFTEDDDVEKIPFDAEPILRGRAYRPEPEEKPAKRPKAKTSKIVYLCLLINLVLAIFGCVMFKQIVEIRHNKNSYTYNISGEQMDLSYASAKGMLSTVCVSANTLNNGGTATNFFSGSMASRGSGVIYELSVLDGSAYIITNAHVITHTDSSGNTQIYPYIWILLWDSLTPIEVKEVVGFSTTYDIAVLKIENSEEIKTSSAVSASIANSLTAKAGEGVVVIGNSMARNLRLTTGVVAVEEDVMTSSGSCGFYLSVSADVNSGNSGGGLYNAQGELLGIVNAKYLDVNRTTGSLIYKEVIHGMNYTIPINIAESVARNIIRANGKVRLASNALVYGTDYGTTDKRASLAENGKICTNYTMVVSRDTNGLKSGDEFVSAKYYKNGNQTEVLIDRIFALEQIMLDLQAGDEVEFTVLRAGLTCTVTFTANAAKIVN